jgi:hypothetical protein
VSRGSERHHARLFDADGSEDAISTLRHLVAIGAEHVETARFRIAVRQNPPAVQVVDADAIPADFIRTVTTTSIDKRAIIAVLKDTGEVVPGVEIVRGTRLEVR